MTLMRISEKSKRVNLLGMRPVNVLLCLFVFFAVSGCELDGTVKGNVSDGINGTGVSGTWNFVQASDYTFNANYIDLSSGNKAALKTVNTTFNNSATFGTGTYSGTAYAGGVLNLDPTAGADTSLSSTWIPHSTNLVGYWKMDGSWADSSGNGNTLSLTGGVTNAGTAKVGTASAVFPGGAAYLSSTTSPAILPAASTTAVTMALWVSPGSTASDKRLFTLAATGGTSLAAIAVNRVAGKFSAFCLSSANALIQIDSATANVSLNAWTHVALSVKEGEGSLYVNGKLAGTSALCSASKTFATTGGNLNIGSDGTGANTFTGSIDDAALWNFPLTGGEIALLYNRQKQKYAGSYDSAVIDMGAGTATWTSLASATSLPFFKEIISSTAPNESTAYPSSAAATLMSGVLGVWHFNGNLNDGSGNGRNLTAASTAVTSGDGLMYNALTPNLGGAQTAGWINLSGVVPFGVSLWFRESGELANTYRWILNTRGDTAPPVRDDFGCFIYADPSLVHSVACQMYLGGVFKGGIGPVTIEVGKWNHLVMNWNGSTYTTYLNGVSIGTSVSVPIGTNTGATLRFGSRTGSLDGLTGVVDEAAAWNRVLTVAEIKELYRRGGNRIKYQARSCVDAACACKSYSVAPVGSATDCDGDGILNAADSADANAATWIGPDGTAATYFSELQNNTAVDASGNPTGAVNVTGLSLDWSGAFFTAGAKPAANRYFQYRVYMESDDANNLCTGAACMPQLTSVTVAPTGRYYGGSPTVVNNTSLPFLQLQGMTKNDTGSCSQYQISTDGGATFKWWNAALNAGAGAWATAGTTVATANYISDFSPARLKTLGSGNYKFRAFLNTNTGSDFTQACEISQVGVTFTH